MDHLAKIQLTFQDSVLSPGTKSSTAWISASGRANPGTQLSIYTHAYRARLQEVLANDFPAVLMAIGEDDFTLLAEDYIQAYPSHYFSLRDFGIHLADYIAERVRHDEHYHDMLWLHELALFEWTLGDAFDAEDAILFTETDMANIPPENWPQLRFKIHPSVQRMNLEWNAPELWQALTADNPKPVTAVQDIASPWLIWREHLITRFRSMQDDEAQALDMLRDGADFNQLCKQLATHMDEEDVPLRAAGLLRAWISQGLISGIHST